MKFARISYLLAGLGLLLGSSVANAGPGFLEYGTEVNPVTGIAYNPDPKAGATLIGLAANAVTLSTNIESHGYPFAQPAGAYAGTDQIYVGSNQTAFVDGYSAYAGRIAGPQVIKMDYASLVGSGESVSTLTLGIAADDFQNAIFGNPFTAKINGVVDVALSNQLNAFALTGPTVQFFTIGISTSLLSNNSLTLTIDEGGNGGDGWAVDFLTIGVTTSAAVPEPGSLGLFAFGLGGILLSARHRRDARNDRRAI